MTFESDPTLTSPDRSGGETIATGGATAWGVLPGSHIGHYRIIRTIGQGGMGTVYEAEQDRPRRTVALKVVRAGLATPKMMRRFELESQVLGRLQHIGIAQVYEAGTADAGQGPQPFFAMEFIRGRLLNDFAGADNLGTRARLELMAKVCDAVHYAHQKGVIHRDLKPGNILVDDTGQPKILDFGVARATDSDVQVTTLQTDVGQIVGTLAYMSPEQVAADPAELDIRSDVYALGVICYELLAGRLPLDVSRKMIHEAARTIQEDDPAPLSTYNRVFRGDVETIVAKALEKEKGRRYASAAELAADLRRYLQDEPIVARPASTTYQLRKFAKRNKGLVGGVVAAFIIMVIASVVSVTLAVQAHRARAAETAQRERAENNLHAAIGAVDKYLTNVSESEDLKAAGLESLRRQLLGTAKDFYEDFVRQKTDDPRLMRELGSAHLRVGNIDRELFQNDRAEQSYLKAMEIFDRLDGESKATSDRLAVFNNLGLVYRDTGRFDEAAKLFGKGIAFESQLNSADFDAPLGSSIANMHDNFGTMLLQLRRLEECEAHHQKGLAIRKRCLEIEPDSEFYLKDVCISHVNLGTLYATTNRLPQAEEHLRQAVEQGRRLMEKAPQDMQYQNALAGALNNIGGVYTLLGDNGEATKAHRESLAIREKMAAAHPAVTEYALRLAGSHTNLGEIAVLDNKPDEALVSLDEAVRILQGVLEKEPRDTTARYYLSYTESWRAKALDAAGQLDDAIAAWDRAIEFDDRNDAELRSGRDATAAKK